MIHTEKREACYRELSCLKEAQDFFRIVRKWDTVSRRVGESGVPMVLPDLLWIARSGVGKTNLLHKMSEYLAACGNLMDFQGNVRYFEFMLDYYPPERPFPEIQRMINEVERAAGFRNIYKGIISVDIEEWLGHCEEKHFLSFLEYLSSNSDNWLIVFNVTGEQEEEIEKLESILSMYFRLEKATLSLPATADLVDFVAARLAEHGLALAPDAAALIADAIQTLRRNKYFDGYKTLIGLCRDIVYELYSADEAVPSPIPAAALSRFAANSAYIERATWRAESKGRIGLLNRGE